MTPNARTLKWLRENGYRAKMAGDRRLPHTHTIVDLFGWIDIIAIRGVDTLGVQATTDSNLSARIKKAKALADFAEWLRYHWSYRQAWFFGWSKRREDRILKSGKRGTRKVWKCRIVRVSWNGTEFVEESL